jgi:hypothetical protein
MVPTGFTLGPMVAQMLANYMTNEGDDKLIPSEFSVDREIK